MSLVIMVKKKASSWDWCLLKILVSPIIIFMTPTGTELILIGLPWEFRAD